MLGALIGAGASLVGGLVNSRQRKKELAAQTPEAIRSSFEAAGFNPLLGIGGANRGLSYAPTMGSSISNAGSQISAGMYQAEQAKIEKTRLEEENRRLDKLVKATTLSNNQRSVYQNGTAPKLGGNNAIRSRNSGFLSNSVRPPLSGRTGGGTLDLLEPDRDIEQVKAIPLTSSIRTGVGGREVVSLNPDAFETGLSEIAGGALIHGAAYGLDSIKRVWDQGVDDYRLGKHKLPHSQGLKDNKETTRERQKRLSGSLPSLSPAPRISYPKKKRSYVPYPSYSRPSYGAQ